MMPTDIPRASRCFAPKVDETTLVITGHREDEKPGSLG